MGKIGQEIEADAIVVCTGAHTARVLKQTLGIYAPLTPIKSYTFDIPTSCPFSSTHLFFHDSAL
jgi:glycine/D-amino acid oxidase-like deaminating enzyme